MLKLVKETSSKAPVLKIEDLETLQNMKRYAQENSRCHSNETYHAVDSVNLAETVHSHLTSQGYDVECKVLTGAGSKSTKHILEFTLNNMRLFRDTKDEGAGKILILNSYNGECSLTVMAGMIRFACANGIISGEKEFFEKLRHLEGETVRERTMRINEKIDVAAEWLTNTFSARIESMSEKTLSFEQEASIIMKLDIPVKVAYEVLRRRHPDNFQSLRDEDRHRDAWSLFNVLNEVIREKSRHSMNEFEHNQTLMNDVSELALAA